MFDVHVETFHYARRPYIAFIYILAAHRTDNITATNFLLQGADFPL